MFILDADANVISAIRDIQFQLKRIAKHTGYSDVELNTIRPLLKETYRELKAVASIYKTSGKLSPSALRSMIERLLTVVQQNYSGALSDGLSHSLENLVLAEQNMQGYTTKRERKVAKRKAIK